MSLGFLLPDQGRKGLTWEGLSRLRRPFLAHQINVEFFVINFFIADENKFRQYGSRDTIGAAGDVLGPVLG
jgi:hypothetical protein